jgi:hypothetical protein
LLATHLLRSCSRCYKTSAHDAHAGIISATAAVPAVQESNTILFQTLYEADDEHSMSACAGDGAVTVNLLQQAHCCTTCCT